MPIFDYKCNNKGCKNRTESFRELVKKHNEEVYCPLCGTLSDKQLSTPNIGGMDNLGRSK